MLAIEKGMRGANATLVQDPPKKTSRPGEDRLEGNGSGTAGEGGRSGGVIIQKLLMNVDIKKIKELKQLLELLKELEDYTNANGGETDLGEDPDPDAVPA